MHFSSFIGNKSGRKGRYGAIDSTGLGSERPLYNSLYDDEDEDPPVELDDIDADALEMISKKINRDANTAYGLEPQRRDMNYFTSPQLIGEKNHTTTARNTIAPFSHKQLYPNGMGPAIGTGGSDSGGQIYRTTGNFRHIGSESGYVDPGTVMFGENDEPLYDIRDINDPMERSFKKHQKNIKAVLDEINECLLDI